MSIQYGGMIPVDSLPPAVAFCTWLAMVVESAVTLGGAPRFATLTGWTSQNIDPAKPDAFHWRITS